MSLLYLILLYEYSTYYAMISVVKMTLCVLIVVCHDSKVYSEGWEENMSLSLSIYGKYEISKHQHVACSAYVATCTFSCLPALSACSSSSFTALPGREVEEEAVYGV